MTPKNQKTCAFSWKGVFSYHPSVWNMSLGCPENWDAPGVAAGETGWIFTKMLPADCGKDAWEKIVA